MDNLELLNVLSRWLHVATAIVVLGGTIFLRFVLMPAAEPLPETEHNLLRERLIARWRKVVMAGIGLFLLTGFYNYLGVARATHHGDKAYHALMGIKIVLAFGVFFLASVLVGRSPKFEPLRRNRKRWLGLLVVAALVIVLISSFLKVTRPGTSRRLRIEVQGRRMDPVRNLRRGRGDDQFA
jgi:hypothetical protein